MLEIVLLILKIAGIILAAILGILIVGLCCALFVPVRYRGDFSVADAEDGGKKNIGAALRATWLLWLVRVYVSYEEAVRVRVKVFFFTVMDTAKEKKASKKKKKREKKEAKEAAGGEEPGPGEEPEREPQKDNTEDTPASKEKKGIKKRISNILQTIRDFCDKLKEIRERAGEIREKAEEIRELWNSGHMAASRSLLWREFLYLLRHTKPGKLEGYLRFGFEDPSVTGYAMAIYGILYALWSPGLSVEPDFERQVLESHIRIKGKIRACHFLKTALRLYFSKDVRRVINDIRKL